jgi:hypothetical protein
MPGNTQIKPMKLTFSRDEDTWGKTITDLDGNIIYQRLGLILFDYQINEEYFDGWEAQMRAIPVWNIVEVERFI